MFEASFLEISWKIESRSGRSFGISDFDSGIWNLRLIIAQCDFNICRNRFDGVWIVFRHDFKIITVDIEFEL